MTQLYRWKTIVSTFLCLTCLVAVPAVGAERPHGLEPADDMPYIPDLGGLRVTTFKNQYGQVKRLSEGVVVRRSTIEGEKATVPAGGFYYVSEVADDAAPLRRDPFLVLGEHAYLVDLNATTKTVNNVSLNKGDKLLLDDSGYRLWFDYATDHYDLPYLQFALISPAGHWPLEFPISTKFPTMDKVLQQNFGEGHIPQIDDFYLDPEYRYGASHFMMKDHDFEKADFESISWPSLTEATFSMSRPWVLDLRQEDFRWYKDKRIYAFRQPEGFLVRVTDWSGKNVLGEQVVRPITAQGYKDRPDQKNDFSFTLPDQDMRIEIAVEPEYMKNSDFMPWSADAPFGWTDGILSLVVYSDLITVKNGEAWPLDNRYKVGLEANLLTGKLQRLVLENAQPFSLDNANTTMTGPIKYSDIWNRPAFTLVADGFKDGVVSNYYLRDAFYQRTDNMVFQAKGRKDIDFFVGRVPTFVSILEDTFLTRLADTSYSTVVEPSHFTSYPKVNSNMAFHSPDPTAPFGGLMRGFGREQRDNRRGEKLTSSEGLVIRGSYVDWRNDRIVIPPSGLFYTSRNARNVRALHGETFFVLGKRAYIAAFESTTFVRKDFDVDFWKHQPDASMNPIFWQDAELGENNKMLRYTQHSWLDDRPMSIVNIVKYSGNNFGAPFLTAQGLNQNDKDTRYNIADHFAEGATWIIPEFIGENYMRVKELGTPSITKVEFTFKEPKRVLLTAGATSELGEYTIAVTDVQPDYGMVSVEIRDKSGAVLVNKNLGPLNDEARAFLPQHQKIVNTLQLLHGEEAGGKRVMAEMDINKPFEDGQAALWLYTEVQSLASNTPLPTDPRFMVRPDVCGHCYQLNELLFDNPEPIILDKNNPRFDGPKNAAGEPMFSLVIDSFDGEMIHGWHIETLFKGKTFTSKNMAFNPRTNIDCLMGVNGTVEGFLRASMMERSAYQEYWRRGVHVPPVRGLDAWMAHKFQ